MEKKGRKKRKSSPPPDLNPKKKFKKDASPPPEKPTKPPKQPKAAKAPPELEEEQKTTTPEESKAAPAPQLSSLLSFQKEDSNLLPTFSKMASSLLNNYLLFINKIPFRLRELEFYFNSPAHSDTFTHGDEMQKRKGEWYFHRSGKTYKGGTYKGLDISIGQGSNTVGGILIRSIRNVETAKIIDGPCLCVDTILSHTQKPRIVDLVKDAHFRNMVAEEGEGNLLYLKYDESIPKLSVFSGPRVGLSLKRWDEEKPKFIGKCYRFYTEADKVKKGKDLAIIGLLLQGKTQAECARILKPTSELLKKCVENYNKGKDGTKKPEDFKGNLTKEEYYEMFGVCQKES